MLNPIQIAFNHIYQYIPPEVMNATFEPHKYGVSLDECVMERVIRRQVLPDINIAGGKLVNIVLSGANAEYCPPPANYIPYTAGSYSVYRIFPEAREYRPIVGVVSLRYPYDYSGNFFTESLGLGNNTRGTTMAGIAMAALNSETFENTTVSPKAKILTGDMIQIQPPQVTHIDWVLECRLGWDEHFTGMEATSIDTFRKLVYAAVRIYIYTAMGFAADRVYLSGGQELNIMKDYITEGRDFIPQYQELLEEMAGSSLLDRSRLTRIISWM